MSLPLVCSALPSTLIVTVLNCPTVFLGSTLEKQDRLVGYNKLIVNGCIHIVLLSRALYNDSAADSTIYTHALTHTDAGKQPYRVQSKPSQAFWGSVSC